MSTVRSRSPAAAAGRPFFALALAATLLFSLASTASALPTFRRAPVADATAVELRPESLFRRAAPHVGPTRPVERLRLRRDLESVPHGRRNAEVAYVVPEVPVAAPVNPKKIRRNAESRPANPKSKRDVVTPLVQAARPVNPKAKRSPIVVVDSSTASEASVSAAIVSNPKKRSLELQKRAVIEASISVSPSTAKTSTRRSLMNRVRRFLALRDTSSTASGSGPWSGEPARIILVIPNPKSPNYPGNQPSGSSSTTTTTPASTTTSKPAVTTTTSKPVTTTTSKPVTTTTTTTTSSAPSSTGWPAEKMLSGAYYPSWVGDVLAPNQINYRLFDVINFGELRLSRCPPRFLY